MTARGAGGSSSTVNKVGIPLWTPGQGRRDECVPRSDRAYGNSAEWARDGEFPATLLRVDRRHTWASALVPTGMARRLWARFEVMPFRYGASLVVGTLAAVVLLVGGLVAWGGGAPDRHGTPGRARPSHPPQAAVPPVPTWGAYVPPRKVGGPARVPASPRVLSVPPRRHPAHAAPRSSPSVTCPPRLKRWTWLWEVCKRKQNG